MGNKKVKKPLGSKETQAERAKRIQETGDGRFASKITLSRIDKARQRNSRARKNDEASRMNYD